MVMAFKVMSMLIFPLRPVIEILPIVEESGVRQAVECFSEARGLDRSLEIAADLNNLSSSEQLGNSSTGVSPAAAAYVAYLKHVAQSSLDTSDLTLSNKACLR